MPLNGFLAPTASDPVQTTVYTRHYADFAFAGSTPRPSQSAAVATAAVAPLLLLSDPTADSQLQPHIALDQLPSSHAFAASSALPQAVSLGPQSMVQMAAASQNLLPMQATGAGGPDINSQTSGVSQLAGATLQGIPIRVNI